MALILTDDETKVVQQKRKNEQELPDYYDANFRTNVKISRDFEAFLILAPDNLKTSAIDWIKKSTDIQKANKLRDDLVTLALEKERVNAQAIMGVMDERLSDFNDFRQNFQTSDTFAAVPEVQQFIFDLQRVVEELAATRERAQFDDTASQVIQRGNDNLVVTDPQIEQLQSWQGVLSAYLQG